MKQVIRATVASLLLLSLSGVLLPHPAFACSCATGTPQEALETAATVFSGTVRQLAGPNENPSAGSQNVTFAVTTVWKGQVSPQTVVYTAWAGASCGYAFQAGREYLVYTYQIQDQDRLQVSLCSRTTLLAKAAEDLASLGPGTRIAPSGGTNRLLALGALAVLLIATGAGLYALNRRWKRV